MAITDLAPAAVAGSGPLANIGAANVLSGGSYSGGLQDLYRGLSGQNQADAAREAAALQLQGVQEGIAEVRAGRLQAQENLSPFREAGAAQLEGISQLLTSPEAQLNFIQNNPFYNELANQATNSVLANQAARGKVGSGGTLDELQRRRLLLGNELLNQNIGQRFNLATLGANAAAGQATNTQQTSRTIADLIGSGAAAQGAGVVGAANAQTNQLNQLLTLGALAASDRETKTDIKVIGQFKEFPVYSYRYLGQGEEEVGLMAQDVEEVYPDVIKEIKGIKHIDYGLLRKKYAH